MADQKRSFDREHLDDEIEQLLRIMDPSDLAELPDARLVHDLRRAHLAGDADTQSLARVYARLHAHKYRQRATAHTTADDLLTLPRSQKGWRSLRTATKHPNTIPANKPDRPSRSRLAAGAAVLVVCALLVSAFWIFNGMRARNTVGTIGSPQPGATPHSIHNGKLLCSLSTDKNYPIVMQRPQLGWSATGVLADQHGTLRAFDPQTCTEKSVNWPANSNGRPVWSPDGKHLLLLGGSTAEILDTTSGQTLATIHVEKAQSPGFAQAAWTPDGTQIVTVAVLSYDTHYTSTETIQVWNASTGALIRTVKTATVHTGNVTVSSNGKYFALETPDYHVQFWDVATGQMVSSIASDLRVGDAVWSPDGAYLAIPIGSSDWPATPAEVQIYATGTGQHVATFQDSDTFEGLIGALAWSPDGQYLAESGYAIHIWDVKNQKQVATFGKVDPEMTTINGEKTSYWVAGLVWSPDGRMLASVAGSEPWNPAAGGGLPEQKDTLNVWQLS